MESISEGSRLAEDIKRLRALMLRDARSAGISPGEPKLLMLAGLPGSGKSTFAAMVNQRYAFVTLESDRLRKVLTARPQYTPGEHSRVFRSCHRLIDEFLAQGYPVLFDATNATEKNRKPLYAIARRRGVPLAIAVVSAPSEAIRQRLEARESGLNRETWSDAGWDIYTRMAQTWQPVRRPHIEVDTSEDMADCLERVLRWAHGEPEPDDFD